MTVFPLYVSGYWLAIRLATAVNTASARALSTPSRKRTKVPIAVAPAPHEFMPFPRRKRR